jgi:hypothetical protein
MTGEKSPEAMSQHDLMSRSGARFCEEHDRWECAAKKPNHHAAAIRGMAMCRHHVGRSTAMAKALGEANLLAWSTQETPDGAPMPDPGLVVLQQLRVASLRADLFGLMLRWQLEVDDEQGLVGDTYTAGVEGSALRTGEQVRGLVKLEAEWRDRTVRYAKTAHDMGIAEREVRVAERTGQQLAGAVRAILEAVYEQLVGVLGKHKAAKKAVEAIWGPTLIEVVPRELRRLSGETVPGEVEEP